MSFNQVGIDSATFVFNWCEPVQAFSKHSAQIWEGGEEGGGQSPIGAYPFVVSRNHFYPLAGSCMCTYGPAMDSSGLS